MRLTAQRVSFKLAFLFLFTLAGLINVAAQEPKASKTSPTDEITGLKGELLPTRDNAIEIAGILKGIYEEPKLSQVALKYAQVRKDYAAVVVTITELMKKGDKKVVEALQDANHPSQLHQRVERFRASSQAYANDAKILIDQYQPKGTEDKKTFLEKVEEYLKVLPTGTTVADTVLKFIISKLPGTKRKAAAAAFQTECVWATKWSDVGQSKSTSEKKQP